MHICSDDILNHTFNFMVGPTPIKLKISEHITYKGSAIFSQVNSSVEFHFFSLAWSLSETESTWWLKVISLSWVFFFFENLINMYISPSLGPTILVLRYGHSFPWVGPTIHLNVWNLQHATPWILIWLLWWEGPPQIERIKMGCLWWQCWLWWWSVADDLVLLNKKCFCWVEFLYFWIY